MMVDATVIISAIGLVVATVGGGIALYNARKAALWKRAELANAQMKELLTNEELTFACRCLDWNGGRLVLPKSLRPLVKEQVDTIEHDRDVLQRAINPQLFVHEVEEEPRLQVYRTALDTLLTWLSATNSAIDRNLYTPSDIEDAGYWLLKAIEIRTMPNFITEFGYRPSLDSLASKYGFTIPGAARTNTVARGGFGSSLRGRSAGG